MLLYLLNGVSVPWKFHWINNVKIPKTQIWNKSAYRKNRWRYWQYKTRFLTFCKTNEQEQVF